MSPTLRAVIGFLALFMVSAFGPAEAPLVAPVTIDAPIAASFAAAADIALEGHWQGMFATGEPQALPVTVSISRGANKKQGRGQYVITINGGGQTVEYAAHTSALRGMKFLNIRLPGRPNTSGISGTSGKRARYVLALYSISGSGTLSLRTIPAELAREAVISGQLQGRFRAANANADVASASALQGTDSVTLRQFLRQIGPARVFSGQWGRFRRAAPQVIAIAAIAPANGIDNGIDSGIASGSTGSDDTRSMTHLASASARR